MPILLHRAWPIPVPNWSKILSPVPAPTLAAWGSRLQRGSRERWQRYFRRGESQDLKDVSVKISGCHNSCAQHHIATIGLHGVGKRIGEHVAPFYELHLGGKVNGTAKIGQMVVKLPAKSVSAAITHLIDVYRRDRLSGEGLPAFIDRVGKVKLK